MRISIYPPQHLWDDLLKRPVLDNSQLIETVGGVLQEVQQRGDAALKDYTERFDKVALSNIEVQPEEYKAAEQAMTEDLKKAIQTAKANIQRFHEQQKQIPVVVETMPGVRCWRKSVGIERVGLYIPGGTAPLFSTILMLGVPAQIAACQTVVLCTPPRKDGTVHPAILYTAKLVGIDKVFKVGGSQAIAGMAYGTATIPNVFKIFGPGNQYVTAAKQLVSQHGVAIDMPAGPSEVLVCADKSANPDFVAADLLSQAEHGIDSQVVLLAFDKTFVKATHQAIAKQLAALPRKTIAQQALEHSLTIIVEDRATAQDLINRYAPEHLILSVNDALGFSEGIFNAGSIFLGNYTPESVGDYASGTNHTLPTNGYARAYSGVSLDSFVKKITFQELSKEGLAAIGPVVEIMAQAEALDAHKNAVSIRLA